MSKVKAVSINKKPVDNKTVETLEGLLKSAKTGDLTSLIYIDGYSDGTVGSGWTLSPDDKMIVEMDKLKLSILMELSGIETD